MIQLPNLELLLYQANELFIKDKNLLQQYVDIMNSHGFRIRYPRSVFMECEVFMQTWSSTACAFDVDENNNPVFGGQAITNAYTTVFHEPETNVYYVFVDNEFCYLVTNPTDKFLEDLKTHHLGYVSEARKLY